jgi:hypothetical protein
VASKNAGQQSLLAAQRRKRGTVERNAEADLRELRTYKALVPGMKALESAYKLMAREIDLAGDDVEGGTWKAINASREMRAVRERLGLVIPAAVGEEANAFWTSVSAPVRD